MIPPGARRSQLIQVYESVMDAVAASRRQNLEGQLDFFSMADGPGDGTCKGNTPAGYPGVYPPGADDHGEGHHRPLSVRPPHGPVPGRGEGRFTPPPSASILEDFAQEGGPTRFADDQKVTLCGVVTASKTKTTKNNSLMAYVTVEDDTASMELLCFARVLDACGAYLKENQAVVVRGRLSVRDEKAPQVLADSVYPLSTVKGGLPPEKPKGEKALEGQTLYLKFPSLDHPGGAPHEAGIQHVPRHHTGADGDGGYPEGLRRQRPAAPGPGGGGQGDPGRGERGGQVTA